MAPTNKLAWKFPLKKIVFFKIEVIFIALLALTVFLLSFQEGWFYSLITVVIFLGIYVLISVIVQKIRKVEEHYQLSSTHFQVTRKIRNRVKKDKVPLKDIKKHKLSRRFLGGYLITHNKKHLLFFNSKEELDKFDRYIRKHYKSRNKKVAKKKPAPKKRKR